jgi:hypothetical protein
MPASHWSFELTHGNGPWLTPLLQKIGVDPNCLTHLTIAAAIEFAPGHENQFSQLIQGLLENLTASDFYITFPHHPAICMLHHHKQLWWVTTDDKILAGLDRVFETESNPA